METSRRASDLSTATFGLSEPFRARFEILEEVARGGMGVVLKARDRVENRALAIKLLFSGAASDEARFRREVGALQAFRHPNIVRLYGAGTDGRRPYLLMELIEGSPLRPEDFRRSDGSIDFDSVVRIFAVIADALASCHAAGFAHRDLKPDNILVEAATRRPVLVDFGLVKVHEQQRQLPGASVALTNTGELVGTPAFMAPEQFCPSEFGAVGPAVDVWGLAACLFFLLSGRTVYPDADLVTTLAALMRADPPRLRELEPATPAWLDDLLAACLRRAPSERPNIRSLADSLEQRGQAHALGRAVASSLQARRSGRRRWILGLAAALTALALGSGGLVWERQRSEAARRAAQLRSAAAAVAAIERSLGEGAGFGEAPAELEGQIAAAKRALPEPRSAEVQARLNLARAVLEARRGEAFAPPQGSPPRGSAAARLLSWSEALAPRPPSPQALSSLEESLGEAREADAYFVLDLALVRLRTQVALGQARSAARGARRDRLFERLPAKATNALWTDESADSSSLLAFLHRLRGDRSAAARALERLAWRDLARRGGLAASSERDRQELFESLESAGPWTAATEADLAVLRGLLEIAERSDKAPSPQSSRSGDRPAALLLALLTSAPELGPRAEFDAALTALQPVIERRVADSSTQMSVNFARSEQVMEPIEKALLERSFALISRAAAAAEAGGRRAQARRFQATLANLLVGAASIVRGRARTGDLREALMARFGDMGLALPLAELPASVTDYRREFWIMKAEGMRRAFRNEDPTRLEELQRELRRAIEAQRSAESRVRVMRGFFESFLYTGRGDLIRDGLPELNPEDQAASPKRAAWILACRGQAMNAHKRYREATRLLEESLALDIEARESWQPFFHKALAHGRLGEHAAAAATLDQAGRKRSFRRVSDWVQLLALAQQLDDIGAPGGVVARMERAIARRSAELVDAQARERAAAALLMAQALRRLQAGDRDEAVADLKRMAEQVQGFSDLSPRKSRSLVRRIDAFCAEVEGDRERALGDRLLKIFGDFTRRSSTR